MRQFACLLSVALTACSGAPEAVQGRRMAPPDPHQAPDGSISVVEDDTGEGGRLFKLVR